ncbi:MAG: hypothetical protein P1V51_08990 [Deltaproteobacteria bacterium]|nr:hypothetical protein [Deltaproteobacteria bacterium]
MRDTTPVTRFRPIGQTISSLLAAIALAAGVIGSGTTGCARARPVPEAEAPPAPPPAPAPAAEPAADTSTLNGRLQKLGQELQTLPETTSRRFAPELERIEKMRDDLAARLKREGEVVGEKIEGAVQTLEDDLRVLRSRMSAPPAPSDDEGEGDAETTSGGGE